MNRDFFITGAAQGLGLQFTRRALLGTGRVVMADLDKEEGKKAVEELEKEFGTGKVCFVHLDVRDKEMWKAAWDEAELFFGGQVEALMNNAGVFSRTNWELMLDVNLKGLAIGTMLAIERMGVSRGGQGGLIFQTSSMASLIHGLLDSAEEEIYTATKCAIMGLTRSMGKHETWIKEKVKMVAVCPWVVNTSMIKSFVSTAPKTDGSQPLTRWYQHLTEPEDVALAVEQAITNGESGDVITVGPGIAYYYPDIQMMVFILYKLIHTILVTVGRVPRSQAVKTHQLGFVFGVLILGIGFLFHLVLSCLGL